MVLQKPDLNIFRQAAPEAYPYLSQAIHQQLVKYEARGKLLLPNLLAFKNESIGIFSDYSGEGSGNYFTYSFLVCAFNCRELFHREMRRIRNDCGLGDKEVAFKDLRMGSMRKALPAYLERLERYVPGLIFTLAIDKRITSVFGPAGNDNVKHLVQTINEGGFGTWKAREAEKLLRVTHTSALLAGLLGHEGQKIFWMTDHDAICPNEKMYQHTLALFQNVLSIYTAKKFALVGGARPFEERSIEFLDMLSAADIAAGAIAHYLTRRDTMGPDDATVRDGAATILNWLGHQGLGLKKLSMLIRQADDGGMQSAIIEINPRAYPIDLAFVPLRV